MLHSFYREFLGLMEPAKAAGAAEQAMQERLTACRGSRGCAEHLTDAFTRSEACARCGLLSAGCGQFADWRATALRRLVVQDAVIGCWVGVMSAPFDWARIRRSDACLCPFVVRCGDSLVWRPAAVEATCLLLAQSYSVGVDLHLRVRGPGSSDIVPCHSFLMGAFVQMYRSGGLPAGLLRMEGGRLTLELDCKRYPWELVQFVFYSAYGHVLCLGDSLLSSRDLAMLRTVVTHLICDSSSVCRHLVDASGLLTNVIVMLDMLVRDFRLLDQQFSHLLSDLISLFRVSRLFDDLRQKLMSRVCAEVKRQLSGVADATDGDAQRLSNLHRCGSAIDCNGNTDCPIFDLAVDSFRQLVLQSEKVNLDCSLQTYLASLVCLYETNHCDAMVKACRDMRCISGILCLIGTPCSANLVDLHSLLTHLCHTLMLLVCDQVVLNFADVLCSAGGDSSDTELATVSDFQFVASFASSVIAALDQLSNSYGHQALSISMLRALRSDLSRPEISSMIECQTAKCSLAKVQARLVTVSSRDLRRVAYASYTAGKLPRVKSLVQALALILGEVEGATARFDDGTASPMQLCSEGRRILCTEGSLAKLLDELSPNRAMVRLQTLPDASWDWLTELTDRSSCCCGSRQTADQTPPTCQDHGDCGPASCLLFAWICAATRCASLLRQSGAAEQAPTTFVDVKDRVRQFAAEHRDCFLRQADELLASGEMEPDRHGALTAALLAAVGASSSTSSGCSDGDAGIGKTSFVMRLLPSLQFQFEPHSNCH